MDPNRASSPNPGASPLYPSIDQFQQPPPQRPPQEHGYPQNAYNPNYPSYPPSGSFFNPQQSQGKQVFDDLGAAGSMISGVAFGPVGSSVINSANQYVGTHFGRFLTLLPLKYYFNVNNSYVFNKIKLLLCPFLHKSWKRRIGRHNEVDSYVPPREDINAPDLYIPVMAFVTYILLIGFVHGAALKFTPEVLGVTASTGLAILVFEILLVKAGFYLLNCGNIAIYDLTAYCGYKFVGVVVNIIVGILSSSYIYHAVTLYTGICMAIFMVRTLRIVLTLEQGGIGMGGAMHGGFTGPGMGMGPGTGAGVVPGTGDGGMTRNYFLLIVAILQVLLVYFLGVTP